MTEECQEYIKSALERFREISGFVLEVGSYDINGNPRAHFSDRRRFPIYCGIDMRDGPGVDQVMNCQSLTFGNASFDVVVDMERLEHDARFWDSYREIARVLRPGGHILITTRSWGGFGPHDFPSDYWRFMDNGVRYLLESSGIECLESVYAERRSCGDQAVFACGRKNV